MPRSTGKKGRKTQIPKPHLKLSQGQVAFRLLCHSQIGSAVIGHGGSESKKISQDTGAYVHVADPLPDCDERIIYVTGSGKLDKILILKGERKFEVSAAQLALFRVWDILEAFSTEDLRCCRLLTMKGEEKIKSFGGIVGASIRVLHTDDHPLCADFSDDLIQITGDSLSVTKALLAVTFCLQGNISRAISQFQGSVSYGVSHDMHGQKHLSIDTDATDGGQSSEVVGTTEVAFRLLCPTSAANGLIDWGGNLMMALRKETGARIEVLDPVVGCDECVIVVSAMENKEWQYSPAQDATLRVFTRLMEAISESGHASGSNRGEPVTARLLFLCSQANMLDMADTAGADVQILESHSTHATLVGKKIMQVVGEYSDVHTYLLQVTWTLRENIFSSKKIMPPGPPLLPHILYGQPPRPPRVLAAATITHEMDNLAISNDTNISSSPMVPSPESSFGHTRTMFTKNQGTVVASSSSSELGSGDECAVIRNAEVEITVPAHVFSLVYGERGGNLARLRQISGATVNIHDPFPGTDGKVIIRGTPDQTLSAKSMLYGYIMSNRDCVVIK